MRHLNFAALSVCSFGLGVSLCPAQITKSGAGYLMRVKYVKGTTINYTITTKTPMLPKPLVMSLALKVKDVKSGMAKIDTTMTGVPNQPAQTAAIEVDSRNQARGGAGFGAALPPGPIKVGAVWQATVPLQMGGSTGAQEMKATYTFKGMKTLSGKQVAWIDIKMEGLATGSGNMTILASDGTMLSNTTSLNIGMGGKTAALTTTIVRK